MAWMPGGRRFRRLLEANFSRVIATEIVWRNLPPAFVYRCEK
jgi:phospholipid N-methyltransferase